MTHRTKSENDSKRCRECGGEVAPRIYKHVEQVGKAKVTDGTGLVEQCLQCGEVELSLDDLAGYERRAAALVLRDGQYVNGDVIKYARKTLGLRQTELASLLQCAPETVSRWENGTAMPRAEQLALVALIEGVERDGLDLKNHKPDHDHDSNGGTSKSRELEVKKPPPTRQCA